ncbi:MAG: efflux RND transporter periplasmic adaptor subunit [Wolinella sp.]
MTKDWIKKGTILVLGLILAGCSGGEQSKSSQAAAPKGGGGMPPAHVDVRSVKLRAIPVTLEYPARVRSVQRVEVRAKVNGTILKKHYTEGAMVREGELLFSLDPSKFRVAANQASARVGVQEAIFRQSEREWKRMEQLFADGVASEKERDDTLASYEMASANLTSAQAAHKSAQIDLSYTSIVAPSSGVAGQKLKDVGAYVGGSDTLLTTITQLDPIHVEFAIPDFEQLRQNYALAKGDWKNLSESGALRARIISKNGVMYPESGIIDFTDSVIDEKIGSTHARALFKNSDHVLLPGQFVRVRIEGIVRQKATTIPQEALLQNGTMKLVYIVSDGKVAVRPVEVELSADNTKEFVVTKGLAEGDLVITSNIIKIRPDASVQIDRRE